MSVVAEARPWFVYLVECRDGSIYTGIALDVARRYAEHAAGKGAKYTRSHPPARLLGSFEYPDRSAALKAEHAIRRLPPAEKHAMCTTSVVESRLVVPATRAQRVNGEAGPNGER